MPYLHVTSRVYTDPDHELFSVRGGYGFPYLAFLDAEGNLLSQVEARSIAGFSAAAKAAEAAAELTDPVELYLHRIGMEGLSLAEAKAGFEAHRDAIPEAAIAEVEQLIVNRDIALAFYELQREHGKDAMKVFPALAVERVRRGEGPSSVLAAYFYPAAMQIAVDENDAELAAKVLELAEKLMPADGEDALKRTRELARKVGSG